MYNHFILLILIPIFCTSQNSLSDSTIMKMMRKLEYNDQFLRIKTDSIRNKYGVNSKEWETHWSKIENTDSLNIIILNKILRQKTICELFQIDSKYSSIIFLVLHHNEKKHSSYFKEIKRAHKKKCISSHQFSLITDRRKIHKNKKQKYGTQVSFNEKINEYYVLPLKSPCKVNKRREKISLPPIELYLSTFDILWDCKNIKPLHAQ